MPQTVFTIHDLTWDGRGVSRDKDGRVVMISGALPGDSVTTHFSPSRDRGPLLGRVVDVVTPSPDRIPHPCPYHLHGCFSTPLGSWRYESALAWKVRHLGQTLRRIGGIADPVITDPIASPLLWGYRERLELHPFQTHGRWWLGYLTPEGFSPLKDCLLASDPLRQGLTRLVLALGGYPDDSSLQFPRVPHQSEYAGPRLLIRDNGHQGVVAVLFIRRPEGAESGPFTKAFQHAGLAGWQIRHAPSMKSRFFISQIVEGQGDPHVYVNVGAAGEMRIDPTVFIQVNRECSAMLLGKVMDVLPDQSKLLDLYGGYGAFSLEYALKRGGSAVVVEASLSAVRAGQAFAREHGLQVEYVTVDLSLSKPAAAIMKRHPAVVMDPPRSGSHPEIIRMLNENGSPLLIYVSCHPAALARDFKLLPAYRPRHFTPIDLFPQTPNLETIAVLDRV